MTRFSFSFSLRLASRSILAVSLGVLAGSTLACASDVGTNTLEIVGSTEVTAGLTSADDWAVSFDSFVVVVHDPGLIERSDDAPAYLREVGVTVWDVVQPVADDEALTREVRASVYDGADFRIAPASASGDAVQAGNVDTATLDAAIEADWAVHVVGSATSASNQTIRFDWSFDSSVMYRCKFASDDELDLGADGEATTALEIRGQELLQAASDTAPSFDAIAAADANTDGVVTQAELESAGVWDAIESGSMRLGGYAGASCPIVEE